MCVFSCCHVNHKPQLMKRVESRILFIFTLHVHWQLASCLPWTDPNTEWASAILNTLTCSRLPLMLKIFFYLTPVIILHYNYLEAALSNSPSHRPRTPSLVCQNLQLCRLKLVRNHFQKVLGLEVRVFNLAATSSYRFSIINTLLKL